MQVLLYRPIPGCKDDIYIAKAYTMSESMTLDEVINMHKADLVDQPDLAIGIICNKSIVFHDANEIHSNNANYIKTLVAYLRLKPEF